jgi:hypothetical protein
MSVRTLSGWLLRLARLDMSVLQDAASTAAASGPLTGLVVACSLVSGLGPWLWWTFQDFPDKGEVFLKGVIIGGLLQVAVWLGWVYVSYLVATQMLGGSGELMAVFRAMTLAFVPMALAVLMFIEPLAIGLGVLAVAGTAILSQAALQATTGVEAGKAAMANLVGLALFALVMSLLGATGETRGVGGVAPGVFFFSLE